MRVSIDVVGKRVRWVADMTEIAERLDEIGCAATHNDLYIALGWGGDPKVYHGDDSEFTFECNGFEKFCKEYVMAGIGTREEVEARARELLVRIDDWLRGLERTPRRFSVSVVYPQLEGQDE